MKPLAQNDTLVSQAECISHKETTKKSIIAEARHGIAGVAMLCLATIMPNKSQAEESVSVVPSGPVAAQVQAGCDGLPSEVLEAKTSEEIFLALKQLGIDIEACNVSKVISSDELQSKGYDAEIGKNQPMLSREQLGMNEIFTKENIVTKLQKILQDGGMSEDLQGRWKDRLAELSPNDDEAELLNRVMRNLPGQEFKRATLISALLSSLTIHKYLGDIKSNQVPLERMQVLKLNLLADIHNLIREFGGDVSEHVRLYINGIDGKELSYTVFLPVTLQHMENVRQNTGLDITPVFQEYVEKIQQEFIAKAKEVGGKPVETAIAKIEKANAITQWMLAVEQGKIGLQKAQAFRDAYAQLSPEDQKAFVSTIDTKSFLSSGTTQAHVAFNGLKDDQRSEFDELVKPRVKKEADLIKMISQIYASTDRNEDVLAGIEKNSAGVGRFQPVVASLGVSKDTYMTEAFILESEAMDWSKLTDVEKEAKKQASLAKTQAETASIAQENASIAQENAELDKKILGNLVNIAKNVSTDK